MTISLVAAALLLTGCTAVATGQGSAGAAPSVSPADRLATGKADLHSILDGDPNAVNDYWSAAKRAQAQPIFSDPTLPKGQPIDPGQQLVVQSTAGNTSQAAPNAIGQSGNGDPYPLPGLSGRTIGKLFFNEGDKPFVCSAAVVSSKSGSTLATAAHCFFTVELGAYNSKLLFIPGFDNGSAPHGSWPVEKVSVSAAYAAARSWEQAFPQGDDIGFGKLAMVNGQTFEQVNGAQGIAFGITPQSILDVGYPAESSQLASFDGQRSRYCADQTIQVYGGYYRIDCLMNGGSSGGPWMTRYDPNLGAGYLIGVTSNMNRAEPYSYGSIFGAAARKVYESVNQ